MSRRAQARANYTEEPLSDEDSFISDEEDGSLSSESGTDNQVNADVDSDEEFDEASLGDDIDAEDRPTRRYKQPGVRQVMCNSKQWVLKLRFADKIAYSAAFGVVKTPQPVKAIPRSVMVLTDPRTKAQKLSEEELVLKKAEATRKRKHFIQKKLEAEKKETLERLLNKRETKAKSASVAPEEGSRREIKKRVLIKHKALFSYSSRTVKLEDGQNQNVSYYSMVI